jgi:hypothetical protein
LIDHGVCDALIACATELAPATHDEFVATYGANGSCWTTTPAQQCRDMCRMNLDGLNQIGQITGQTCGTCQSDADCAVLGEGAVCDAGLCAGGDPDAGASESSGGQDTGVTEPPACMQVWEPPEDCLTFVRCVGALFPAEQEAAAALYGPNGTCWCGSQAEAMNCQQECITQLENALDQYPTVAECHDEYCTLTDLDPSQPYGPVDNGACPAWNASPQAPIVEPLGLPGSFCAPPCSGVSKFCPDHNQTSAEGTCYLTLGNQDYCVSRCYVDPTLIGGSQCQCGATCQPYGSDGEGYLRGICTFE